MAQRVKHRQATLTGKRRAVHQEAQDHADALVPGSFPHHGTDSIYSHDSHDSSSLLADDEDSLDGSPDEADGELRLPHCLPNNSQPVVLEAPHIVAHPQHAKRCSSHFSDGENPTPLSWSWMSCLYTE
jgi:hypothetical protein